jgi:hypothetical protein
LVIAPYIHQRSAYTEALVQLEQLPHLDEHATFIAARVDDVWPALIETLDRVFSRPGAAAYARAVGCADWKASGPRPLAEGSTVPGFRVTATVPNSELTLEGRHRFSSYALIFRLEPVGSDHSRLRAESRAVFPGLPGRIYRLIVVGTGVHVVTVRRLLAVIERRSARHNA